MADGSHESGRGNGSPQPYIVIGHGIEDVAATKNNNFTEGRIQVPEGVTVVSLAQCGDEGPSRSSKNTAGRAVGALGGTLEATEEVGEKAAAARGDNRAASLSPA